MTSFASTMMTAVRRFAEVRCHTCKRLLFKWEYTGVASIEVKCPRCGNMDVIQLSTN